MTDNLMCFDHVLVHKVGLPKERIKEEYIVGTQFEGDGKVVD